MCEAHRVLCVRHIRTRHYSLLLLFIIKKKFGDIHDFFLGGGGRQ